jgi:capsid portal protein
MNQTITLANKYPLFDSHFANGVLNAVSGEVKAPDFKLNSLKKGFIKYPQPIKIDQLYALKDISGHHSSCIQAKKYATVGLGFIDDGENVSKSSTDQEAAEAARSLLSGQGYVTSKVDDLLDPLTLFGFANELLDVAEDFMDCGTGYLEVCRDDKGRIVGLSHIPAKDVWFCTYDGKVFFQYQPLGYGSPVCRYWSRFGLSQKKWLMSSDGPLKNFKGKESDVSELIPFIQPSNRTKYYGYPDWISATVDIDLLKKSKQYKADFYHNRGVLDKILIVTGESVDPKAWEKIEGAVRGSIGGGNNFGSMCLNLGNPDAKVDVKNMGAEGDTEEQFAKDTETLTQNIVSSHGVPPLLANILIPGKLGASNEFVNALVGFQLLRINAYQNVFSKMLASTLGHKKDGIEGLGPEDFRLRSITSQINLNCLETIGKMRSEVTSGENKGRDLEKGVKE